MLHRILVKYTSEVKDREDFARRVLAHFKPLEAGEGIREVRVIPGLKTAANRYDLMIEMDMDIKALPAYDASETHRSWKRDYAAYIETKAIFDCED